MILMKHYPRRIISAANCGDNCSKWILKLGNEMDFTINLYHIMNFGYQPFEIRIMNAGNSKMRIAHNMQEFLDAGLRYL